MQRKISRTMLSMMFSFALFTGLAPAAHAQQCSPSQVAGKWAFWTQGNVIGTGPRVSAGIFTLDNSENVLHGKATSSLNGTIFSELFSGTYSVNQDCTGELTVLITDTLGNKLFTVTLEVYFDDNAKEIRGIFSSVALASSGSPLATSIVFDARKIGEH